MAGMRSSIAMITKRKALAAGSAVAVAAAAGGFFLLLTGTSNAATPHPPVIPTTMAQIRADMKTNPTLARLGLMRLHQAELRAHKLTPAQRAAAQRWISQQNARHKLRPGQKPPQEKSGIFPIRNGVGPWPSCVFYGHNLYVSPPMGKSGVQYRVYAGNIPPEKQCVDSPIGINMTTAGYGGVFEMTYNGPSTSTPGRPIGVSISSPLQIVSAHGDTVILRSLSGREFTFNFVTRKFVT